MHFLTPLAFTLAALLPVVVLFYFLKLRREERLISSVYLWQEMVRDVAANAPWQRLRPNLLLLLQLLFLTVLILALARPFTWTRAAATGHLILVVDTSASMTTTDVQPDRLTAALAQARRLAASLPADAPVTLIAAGSETEVLLSAAADRAQLGRALENLRPTPGVADMTAALELAAAIAAGEPDAQVAILSDGGVRLPERLSLPANVRYLAVGASGENQAVSALTLDLDAAGQGLTAFVRATNYGRQQAQRRLTLHALSAGGTTSAPAAVRDLTLPPGESVALTIPDLPPWTVAVEARLGGEDPLPLDDRAWAVAPVIAGAQVQIVGPGNRFLETALALLPGVEVTTLSLEDYGMDESTNLRMDESTWLTIFDAVLPESGDYPPGALFFIAPPRSTEFFSVTGALELPLAQPAGANEPLLRYVDLRGVTIQRAARLTLPAWGRPAVVSDEGNAPLLVVGESDGRRLAVLAFDLRQSDLPLRVAFPLLVANLVDFLAPGVSGGLPATVPPGQPLAIPLPPQAQAALVTLPDGTSRRLEAERGEALFAETALPGVYEAFAEAEEGQQWLLGRFAVNLFNPQESDIAPRASLALAGGEGTAIPSERPARREWWRPLAWGALMLLMIEWLAQHRGALAWIWNRMGGVSGHHPPKSP